MEMQPLSDAANDAMAPVLLRSPHPDFLSDLDSNITNKLEGIPV